MGYCCRIFSPAQPVYPVASVRDFLSGAYTVGVTGFVMGGGMRTRLGIAMLTFAAKTSAREAIVAFIGKATEL